MEILAAFVPSLVIDAILIFRKTIISKTVFGFGFSASQADVKAAFDKEFADGKRAADFSGMIVQSGFCLFSFKLLINKSSVDGLASFERTAMQLSSAAFFCLSVYLFLKAQGIVFLFFLEDAPKRKTTYGKIYPVFISVYSAACFWFGQWTVVRAIVDANPALK